MKIKSILVAALIMLPVIARAQLPTNAAPTLPTTVSVGINDIIGWATSFNTNYDGVFTNNHGLLWVSLVSIQGQGSTLANEIGLAYEPLNSHIISLEAVMRNGGVAGTIISQGAGVSLNFNIHDLRISAYAEGVYQLQDRFDSLGVKESKLGGEIGIRAFKALGLNTYMCLGIGSQFPTTHQVYMAGVGIRF